MDTELELRYRSFTSKLRNGSNSNSTLLSISGLMDCVSSLRVNSISNNDLSEEQREKRNSIHEEIRELQKSSIGYEDFTSVGIIGKGRYGIVKLVQRNQKYYACKIIDKETLLKEKTMCFYTERNILNGNQNSEWLTKLIFAFQNESHIFLVMDYHPGGDLLSLLERHESHFSESMAAFYSAEIILALHELHSRDFAHMDLKPENVLLNRFGHIRLADFGSATNISKAKKRGSGFPVGTPEYVAPEILNSLNNLEFEFEAHKCDYWSLGILSFEMVHGFTPFHDESILKSYSNIMSIGSLPHMTHNSDNFKSYIEGLLTSAEERSTYDTLLCHPFFADIDWENLSSTRPPIIPSIKNDLDISNFDVDQSEDTLLPPFSQMNPLSSDLLSTIDLFWGFSYYGTNELEGSSSDLIKTIVDLKTTNNELRKKLFSLDVSHTARRISMDSVGVLGELRNRECKELRDSVSQLEKLLELERDERNSNEKKALELLNNLKNQWAEREVIRMTAMRAEVEASASVTHDLTRQNNRLTHELNKALNELESHINVKKGLKNKCVEYKKKLEALSEHCKEQKCQMASQKKALSELASQNDKLKESEQDWEKKIEERDFCIEEYKITNESIRAEYKKKERLHRQVIIGLQDQLSETSKSVENKEGKLSHLESLLSELENKLQRKVDEQRQVIEKSSVQCKETEEKASRLEREKEFLQESLKNLSVSHQESLASNNKYSESIIRMSNELSEMKAQKEKLEKKYRIALEAQECLAKEKDELRTQLRTQLQRADKIRESGECELSPTSLIETLKKENKDLKTETQSLLKQQCQDLENERLRVEEESRKGNERLKRAKDEFQVLKCELENQIESSSKEISKLKSEIENLKVSLESKTKELQDLNIVKVDLRICERKIKEQKESLDYYRDTNHKERSTVVSLREKNDKMTSELESLRDDLKSLPELKEQLRRQGPLVDRVLILEKAKAELEVKISTLDKENSRLKESESTVLLMQKAWSELEDQSKDYETVIIKLKEAKMAREEECKRLRDRVETLETDLTTSKINVNELKSAQAFSLSRIKDLEVKSKESDHQLAASEKKCAEQLELQVQSEKQTSSLIAELKSKINEMNDVNFNLVSKEYSHQRLQESYSALLTENNEMKENVCAYEESIEEHRVQWALLTERLNGEKRLKESINSQLHQYKVKTEQLEKLVEYLQSKLSSRKGGKDGLPSSTSTTKGSGNTLFQLTKQTKDKENQGLTILPYEFLNDKLIAEENKNRQLLKDLNSAKSELKCVHKVPGPIILTSKDKVVSHSIPHRWSNVTNMKLTKCSVCYSNVHFCRTASVCQHCSEVAHVLCAGKAENNCGLPKNLAPVLLRTNSESSKGKISGTLKIPEQGGKYWKSVTVYFHDSNLIVKSSEGEKIESIDLLPDTGFAYTQSSVGYQELLHTSAYDHPHIFKIGVNHGGFETTHIFMAKSFNDKSQWISQIDAIALRVKEKDTSEHKEESFVNKRAISSLPLSTNMYTIIPIFDFWLLGTSQGLFKVDVESQGILKSLGSKPIFQMDYLSAIQTIILIFGTERKLATVTSENISETHPQIVSAVSSCHLFGASLINDQLFVCAIDDCRVSLLKYEDKTFILIHKFSTDQPTSCLRFTDSSVLVITDKIYDIYLTEDFKVDEFLVPNEEFASPRDIFPIYSYTSHHRKRYVVCFQNRGVFVDENGLRVREDILWASLSHSFTSAKNHLFVLYHNAIQIFDLSEGHERQIHYVTLKSPQLFTYESNVYLLEQQEESSSSLSLSELCF